MPVSPVLRSQATYPFVRIEEAKRAAAARGVEILDFGVGDPREPAEPFIRRALSEALGEASGYPLAQGLPELRAAMRAPRRSSVSPSGPPVSATTTRSLASHLPVMPCSAR